MTWFERKTTVVGYLEDKGLEDKGEGVMCNQWGHLPRLYEEAERLRAALDYFRRLRPAVAAFAMLMEGVLRENDGKGGWDDCQTGYLLRRLSEEMVELTKAYTELPVRPSCADHDRVAREAADVANFAMMIADALGALDVDSARAALEGRE